ncbi:MAG TPA: winged helix DNA-binding domain-containing protein [Pseudolysinimonas sp.]|nr:winged helix DNA-binding domain-containing protein [Pseudolysinimonas sp.]
MPSRSFTPARRRLAALRLTALGIAKPTAESPVEAVRHLLALQAQDYAGALWSIALRTRDATAASVEAAHHAGDIVRSWPFRSTLHFVAAEDLGWMLALTADREHAKAAGRHRELKLEPADFARAEHIARDRLHGGARLERRELLAAFTEEGLSVDGQRGAHLLGRLAQSGVAVLCGQNTWTLLDDHVRHPRHLEREAARAEIARRYLNARGPATDRDLAWWTGLTLTDARAAIASVDDEFDRLELDGVSYRMRPGLEEAAGGIQLLPGFDEYVLGYTDRNAQLAGRPPTLVAPGGNGIFHPTIVVNGEIVGTWRRTKKAKSVEVVAQPWSPLSTTARRGFERAAGRYAAHLGLPLVIPS